MRPEFIVLVMSFLLSLNIPVFAQDNEFVVLDPHQIISSSVQSVEQLPVININDEKRKLDYFDPKTMTWTGYSYPDKLEEIKDGIYNIRKHSNGTYLISPKGFFSDWSQNFIPDRWVFDPANGEFSQLKPVCINHAQALSGEGEWVIIDGKGSSYLCNTKTEAMSPPIPSLQADGYCENFSTQHNMISPDKVHFLFFCGGRNLSAFSYDIQKQIFLYLGHSITDSDSDDNIDVIRWLNNNEAIIHSFPAPNPPGNSYYTVDVTRANSLQFIASDMYRAPFYFDNPPHLEWMPCEFGACSPDAEMGFHYYDFVADKMTILPDLPMINGESSVIPDGSGDRLYRHLNNPPQNAPFEYTVRSATLIRFNYETQKQAEIFTGEIEWIEGFSPNGRYVALQIGNDNQVASSALLADNQAHYRPKGQAEIEILDLQTNKIVYQAKGNEWEEFGIDDPMYFTWLDNNTFFIQGVNGKTDQIIQNQSKAQVIAEFPAKSTSPSPDGQFVLVDKDDGTLVVYDVSHDRLIPVIEQPLEASLQINTIWNHAHTLLLTISRNNNVLAKWIVNID